MSEIYRLHSEAKHYLVTLVSDDGTNKLSRARVLALIELFEALDCRPVVLTGNERFFSAGADLNEIRALTGAEAFEFARLGQRLMRLVQEFRAPVYAAVFGYCMGGGLDLALACDVRICAANAVFAHRGATLGIMTGWGGTQRLPRLVGRARALEVFLTGEKLSAAKARDIGLVKAVSRDPVAACIELVNSRG